MFYRYSRYNLTKKQRLWERFFETIPGGLSWFIIIGMTVLSFVRPLIATVIIIAFVLYWLLRLMYMNILLLAAYTRFKVEKETDWMKRIEQIDLLSSDCDYSIVKTEGRDWHRKVSGSIYKKQIENLVKSGSMPALSKDIYHVVIVPTVKESREVVEPGIASIENGSFPSQRILLIIALEQRAEGSIKSQMYELQQAHKDKFFDFLIVEHPSDMEGEARVKGANATYSARKAADYLTGKGIPFENVIVSCFDADTVAVSDYFSCLTYYFMITPDRIRASFQPIPVYHNNIWDVPCFARIIDIGISFFQFVEATDPRTLVTFSSHSMSFKALSEIDYWPTDIISDDSAIYWKAFLHYDGNYQTIPIPIAVSMDIITGETVLETFVNVYKQKRRWAWGVENFPIIMRGFLSSNRISIWKKIPHTIKLLDKSSSWATWSFLLTVIGWLPIMLAQKEFADTTVYYIAPRIRLMVFSLASFGLFVCITLSLLMLPPEKTKGRFFRKLLHCAEWLLIPVVVLFLSALPALDAQTRLMFGGYMEFWVADKYRNKQGGESQSTD